MNKKELGKLGEKLAISFLKKKGYQILDKNYSERLISGPGRGEIDIVAKKENTISFVEVKTLRQDQTKPQQRGRTSLVSPEEKVNFQKQRKLIRTARSWLQENKIPLESEWQIDVIGIDINLATKKAKIRHFKNAISG